MVQPALWPVCARAQTSFYVSLCGNDANPGTKNAPFASVERALEAARRSPGAVTVRLFGGMYRLRQAVVLTPADSREGTAPLTITNVAGERVVISGGAVLKGLRWTKYKAGIWRTRVAADLLFDQLFVNGRLQRMARYPNYDPSARYLGGTAADALSPARAARWRSPAGGYVHALHPSLWGDVHYVITGKTAAGGLALEGGWQNNRRMGMHEKYRYVENIFEELDTANEWFFDKAHHLLYYFPPAGVDPNKATFESPQLAGLFEFRGSEASPVKNITISGFLLTQTVRTFMQNKEPLLRSDWTIYRGGAVLFNGALDCRLTGCTLLDLGGNAIFFNAFNRRCEVAHCVVSRVGGSGVCFVGDPAAVRSPSFEYHDFVPLSKLDRTPGPKTNNYPGDCRLYDNLLYDLGVVEKQSAGVELSMCRRITVSHNTIYDVPRAGINVSEGTWGGHLIEYNDVFNTVKESGDHGAFNSWGRDRYWNPDKRTLDSMVAIDSSLALLDVVEPIVLRNNRMRCDHGWDIDLDDGSSNYCIYNNLCLNGGIKLREGVYRVVENNIIVNNSFFPHVWFRNSGDIFRHNILGAGYKPIGITVWGKEVDYNVFPDTVSLHEARVRGTDRHSVCGPPVFEDPARGDFRVKAGSAAFLVGFVNFAMDSFGVVSPELKAMSRKVSFSVQPADPVKTGGKTIDFMGARVKNLETTAEQSATGMGEARGVLVIGIKPGSKAAEFLRVNDVILGWGDRRVDSTADLLAATRAFGGAGIEVVVFRNQQVWRQKVEFSRP